MEEMHEWRPIAILGQENYLNGNVFFFSYSMVFVNLSIKTSRIPFKSFIRRMGRYAATNVNFAYAH